MTQNSSQPPAGWYPDPAGGDAERFWDGVAWSQSTRDRQPAPVEPPAPGGAYGAPSGQPSGYGPNSGVGQGYGQPTYGGQGYGYDRGYGPQLAGFWWRVLGKLIDNILAGIVYYIVAAATGLSALVTAHTERLMRDLLIWSENPEGPVPALPEGLTTVLFTTALVSFAISAIYRTVMYGTLSATVGQLATGLKVVKDGADVDSKLSWSTAINRGVLGALLWETIGWINGIFAAFTRKKQTLSDMLAKTVVYKVR